MYSLAQKGLPGNTSLLDLFVNHDRKQFYTLVPGWTPSWITTASWWWTRARSPSLTLPRICSKTSRPSFTPWSKTPAWPTTSSPTRTPRLFPEWDVSKIKLELNIFFEPRPFWISSAQGWVEFWWRQVYIWLAVRHLSKNKYLFNMLFPIIELTFVFFVLFSSSFEINIKQKCFSFFHLVDICLISAYSFCYRTSWWLPVLTRKILLIIIL